MTTTWNIPISIRFIFMVLGLLYISYSGHAQKFDEKQILLRLEALAHDSLEGRGFGTVGNRKAQLFLADEFKKVGVPPAFSSGYRQEFEKTLKGRLRHMAFPVDDPGANFSNVPDTTVVGGNVIAIIKGQTNKIIVVTGHHDHLGIRNGEIYNGADDNASGSAALVSIAEYFRTKKLRHTLVMAAVDGEERGFIGANYLVDNFPLALSDVDLNVNLDMIAHNDKNELYVCGTYHYPKLKASLENLQVPVDLRFGHDTPADKGSDNWTTASDHVVFHRKQVPFLYFGVEDHEDYHKASDEFKTINQQFYINAIKSIIMIIETLDEL